MAEIHILDSATIDKIAAGEVVERPVSVVKELVENAVDAGAKHISVEIKEGGISMIRVTDDGSGIEKSQLPKVFYRHATSKIETAEDLTGVLSLGFRGEALSSVAAVAKVELITKTEDELVGSRMEINGGKAEEPDEVGAPTGTTIVVRDLFFNTPVRKKFLKTANTEGSYVHEYMQHLALGSPNVAFQFVMNGQTRFFTSGNGDISEIIYRIWGKEVSAQLRPYEASMDGVTVRGYLGKPILARANRSFETLFVNTRFIKSALLSSAIEEGYRTLLMQHKYPFVVLHFAIDPQKLDVNVHPTKLDIRITEPGELLQMLATTIADTLKGTSLIQKALRGDEDMTAQQKREQAAAEVNRQKELTKTLAQPFEGKRLAEESRYGKVDNSASGENTVTSANGENTAGSANGESTATSANGENTTTSASGENTTTSASGESTVTSASGENTANSAAGENINNSASEEFTESTLWSVDVSDSETEDQSGGQLTASQNTAQVSTMRAPKVIGNPVKKTLSFEQSNVIKQRDVVIIEKPQQMELFEEVDIRQQEIDNFKILGQVFDTYWIITMGEKLYYVDQHAAHEKVMYERLMKHYREKEVFAQALQPPVICDLTPREVEAIKQHKEVFASLGFEVEHFGEDSYALRSVPLDLYGQGEKELFLSALDAVLEGAHKKDADAVLFKIASMSCKAAVKGNSKLSYEEARALFEEMFACENPYHCPHGRPTMISVSKQEMEKRFHR